MKYKAKAWTGKKTVKRFLFFPVKYHTSGGPYKAWLEVATLKKEFRSNWGGGGWENVEISFNAGEYNEIWYNVV